MTAITTVFFVYALLLLVGGIIGFLKAKSIVSLVFGIGGGCYAATAALMMTSHHGRATGLALGLIQAIAMVVVFGWRYTKTKKAMPAIPMAVISLCVALLAGYQVLVNT